MRSHHLLPTAVGLALIAAVVVLSTPSSVSIPDTERFSESPRTPPIQEAEDALPPPTASAFPVSTGQEVVPNPFRLLQRQDRTERGWDEYQTLAGDLDGDGDEDLVWSSVNDRNRTYVGLSRGDGSLAFRPFQDRSERGWWGYRTLLGDVDGDGDQDIIWNVTDSDHNRVYVGLSEGDGTFSMLPYQQRPESGWNGYRTFLGDIDADGDDDLVWNVVSGRVNRTYVGRSRGDGRFEFLSYQDRSEHGWWGYETRLGDLNGDGRCDLVWNHTSGQQNRIYVGLSRGDGTFDMLPFQDHTDGGWAAYDWYMGDLDGDGDDDLVWNITGQNNRVYVALSQGDGRLSFIPHQDRNEYGWSAYRTLVCDVDGDGDDDLIWNETSDHRNRVEVGLSQGDGTFVFAPHQEHASQGWASFHTLCADVDGDGDDDLVWNETGAMNRTYVALSRVESSLDH